MGKIRVFIADDHAVVRQGTRGLLEREDDLEVVGEAGDGEEAVKLIEQLRPDVALIDIAMPKLNGVEVTRQIKPRCPSTAILILTAYDNDEYVFALLEAGAAGYLLKNLQHPDKSFSAGGAFSAGFFCKKLGKISRHLHDTTAVVHNNHTA